MRLTALACGTKKRIVAIAVAKGWRACHCAPNSQSEGYMASLGLRKAPAPSASLGIASRTTSLVGGVTARMRSVPNRTPALSRHPDRYGPRTHLTTKSTPTRHTPRKNANVQRTGLPTCLARGGSRSHSSSPRKLCDELPCQGVHSPCS